MGVATAFLVDDGVPVFNYQQHTNLYHSHWFLFIVKLRLVAGAFTCGLLATWICLSALVEADFLRFIVC
jgi:hypothetical protein